MASPVSVTTSASTSASEQSDTQWNCVSCAKPLGRQPMIHACTICPVPWCISCLESRFVETATSGGEFEPVQCCADIQLFRILDRLSPDVADRYRARYKEYITRDKRWCPVPTCSAFIDMDNKVEVYYDVDSRDHVEALQCQNCSANICKQGCWEIAHSGPCTMAGNGEEAAMLARLEIKQCPSCRRAVDKSRGGCRLVQCRCRARFCYHCGKPPSNCDTECRYSSGTDDDLPQDEEEFNHFSPTATTIEEVIDGLETVCFRRLGTLAKSVGRYTSHWKRRHCQA
jgi:hypothetical protein